MRADESDTPAPFVGRTNDVGFVRDLVQGRGWPTGEKVCAVSIEGPGGIGKSTLVRYALEPQDLATRGYLLAEIAGQEDPDDPSAFAWFERLVNSATQQIDTKPAEAFGRARKCFGYHHEILTALEQELRAAQADEVELGAARALFGAARLGVGTLRRDIKTLMSKQTRDDLEGIWKSIRSSSALRVGRWDRWMRPLKNDMRRAPVRALMRSLVKDFEQLLDPGFGDVPTPYRRLLLILDDYEGLSTVIGRALVTQLIPRLRDATFETLLVLVGRDDIRMTDGAWDSSLSSVLGNRRIVLRPLDPGSIGLLCADRGFNDAETAARIADESHGYPWLANILLDDLQAVGGGRATSYHRFVRRMARFMNTTERRWFEALCFLDAVNYTSIPRVLPEADKELVMDWFINEQSIRSYAADIWKVWPYIRNRVLLYRWSIDPEGCDELAATTQMKWRPGASAKLL